MADPQSGPGWSDAQWELVGKTVTEAFDKANVAGKFLPCYGPLPERDDYVRDESVTRTGNVVTVTDDRTLKLFTLTVSVPLSREQVSDEGLSSALLAFRRAAVVLAQVEDYLVFNGLKSNAIPAFRAQSAQRQARNQQPTEAELREEMVSTVVTSRPDGLVGLVRNTPAAPDMANAANPSESDETQQKRGEGLIRAVSEAIGNLEDRAHPGPFACILGSKLFDDAHTPRARSMVLPADRVKPLLKGPLLRSGQMNDREGIVVSLSGAAIDLVVATPPRVQFLQVTGDAKYLFRVYEKFTLRIKDAGAVESLPPIVIPTYLKFS